MEGDGEHGRSVREQGEGLTGWIYDGSGRLPGFFRFGLLKQVGNGIIYLISYPKQVFWHIFSFVWACEIIKIISIVIQPSAFPKRLYLMKAR